MYTISRSKLEEDSVSHGKIVSAMTKERLSLEDKITELNSTLAEVSTFTGKECQTPVLKSCLLLHVCMYTEVNQGISQNEDIFANTRQWLRGRFEDMAKHTWMCVYGLPAYPVTFHQILNTLLHILFFQFADLP